jgi:hypothetical protein
MRYSHKFGAVLYHTFPLVARKHSASHALPRFKAQ